MGHVFTSVTDLSRYFIRSDIQVGYNALSVERGSNKAKTLIFSGLETAYKQKQPLDFGVRNE
jgi:hypothetical protein